MFRRFIHSLTVIDIARPAEDFFRDSDQSGEDRPPRRDGVGRRNVRKPRRRHPHPGRRLHSSRRQRSFAIGKRNSWHGTIP